MPPVCHRHGPSIPAPKGLAYSPIPKPSSSNNITQESAQPLADKVLKALGIDNFMQRGLVNISDGKTILPASLKGKVLLASIDFEALSKDCPGYVALEAMATAGKHGSAMSKFLIFDIKTKEIFAGVPSISYDPDSTNIRNKHSNKDNDLLVLYSCTPENGKLAAADNNMGITMLRTGLMSLIPGMVNEVLVPRLKEQAKEMSMAGHPVPQHDSSFQDIALDDPYIKMLEFDNIDPQGSINLQRATLTVTNVAARDVFIATGGICIEAPFGTIRILPYTLDTNLLRYGVALTLNPNTDALNKAVMRKLLCDLADRTMAGMQIWYQAALGQKDSVPHIASMLQQGLIRDPSDTPIWFLDHVSLKPVLATLVDGHRELDTVDPHRLTTSFDGRPMAWIPASEVMRKQAQRGDFGIMVLTPPDIPVFQLMLVALGFNKQEGSFLTVRSSGARVTAKLLACNPLGRAVDIATPTLQDDAKRVASGLISTAEARTLQVSLQLAQISHTKTPKEMPFNTFKQVLTGRFNLLTAIGIGYRVPTQLDGMGSPDPQQGDTVLDEDDESDMAAFAAALMAGPAAPQQPHHQAPHPTSVPVPTHPHQSTNNRTHQLPDMLQSELPASRREAQRSRAQAVDGVTMRDNPLAKLNKSEKKMRAQQHKKLQQDSATGNDDGETRKMAKHSEAKPMDTDV